MSFTNWYGKGIKKMWRAASKSDAARSRARKSEKKREVAAEKARTKRDLAYAKHLARGIKKL